MAGNVCLVHVNENSSEFLKKGFAMDFHGNRTDYCRILFAFKNALLNIITVLLENATFG